MTACGDPPAAQLRDGGHDVDPHIVDATPRDAAIPDAGAPDAGDRDGGVRDSGTRDSGTRDGGIRDAGPIVDLDGDGLDDDEETAWATAYLPYLSVAADDGCPLAVGLFRMRPHPADPQLLLYVLVLLFERDCGASSHVGDNEVFGLTIDPTLPPPAGIRSIQAISHQATPCEHRSSCDNCGGPACATAQRRGQPYPVVYYSRNKHGAYLDEPTCDGACFLTNYCTLAETPFEPRLFNAGEPAQPLIRNLTTAGAITSTAGWTEAEVFDFDPWGPEEFGTAGIVSDDLVDAAFISSTCP